MKKLLMFISIVLVIAIGTIAYLSLKKEEYTIDFEVKNYSDKKTPGKVIGARGIFTDGETVTMEAVAEKGYNFYYWQKGNEIISYDTKYEVEASEDAIYTAVFGIGIVKRIKNTTIIVEEKNAKIKVDKDNLSYSLSHTYEFSKLGYWYKNKDEGYNKGITSNYSIKVNDYESVVVYKFHEGQDIIYMSMSKETWEQQSWNSVDMTTINSLKNKGKFSYFGTFKQLYNKNPRDKVVETVNLKLRAGEYLTYAILFENGKIGSVSNYFYSGYGASQTIGIERTIDNISYDVSLEMTRKN